MPPMGYEWCPKEEARLVRWGLCKPTRKTYWVICPQCTKTYVLSPASPASDSLAKYACASCRDATASLKLGASARGRASANSPQTQCSTPQKEHSSRKIIVPFEEITPASSTNVYTTLGVPGESSWIETVNDADDWRVNLSGAAVKTGGGGGTVSRYHTTRLAGGVLPLASTAR